MPKLHLVEPQRWYHLLQKCISFSEAYPWIDRFVPIGADIFTFIYPIFLIFFYVKGIIKKQLDHKEGALFIFLSCFISVVVNICMQLFLSKSRPSMELFSADAGETILHSRLPSSSFPSDHAVVGMSIAVATLIWGYTTKNKSLIFFWYILVLCALIMGFCRIATAVHRPSDIVGGCILGVSVPLFLASPFVFPHVKRWLITPLIKLQEWMFSFLPSKK